MNIMDNKDYKELSLTQQEQKQYTEEFIKPNPSDEWGKTIQEAHTILCDLLKCEIIINKYDELPGNQIENRRKCFKDLNLGLLAKTHLSSQKQSLNWFYESRFVTYTKEECVDILRLFPSQVISDWFKNVAKDNSSCEKILKNYIEKKPIFMTVYLRCLKASDKKNDVCNELHDWLKENNLQINQP